MRTVIQGPELRFKRFKPSHFNRFSGALLWYAKCILIGDEDRVRGAISGLDPDAVLADMDAATDFGEKLPLANGKIAVVGFSWGGWKSFAFATHRKDLNAVFVFYGTGPEDVTTVTAPVYGFYAGEDGGVDVTIPSTIDQMKAANKFYVPVTYEGAEHGFMRLGEDRTNMDSANKVARDQAFTRLVTLLREMKPMGGADH
jgi:carboxymethylenebutenolidase